MGGAGLVAAASRGGGGGRLLYCLCHRRVKELSSQGQGARMHSVRRLVDEMRKAGSER